jgi:site-specific DNA-cytosine methylase
MNLRSLELFSGKAIFSQVARDKGIEAFTLDIEPRFEPDIIKNILDFDPRSFGVCPDVLWASPDCRAFSVASIGKHWTGGNRSYIPKSETAKLGIKMVEKTLSLINFYEPKYWFIENPVGVLRKLPMMKDLPRRTIWQCRYGKINPINGLRVAKPTDIWTNFEGWMPRPVCHNGNPDHAPSPRGSSTGTQSAQKREERAELPRELCEEIWNAILEKERNEGY